jgi:hypothetical protein
MHPLRALLLRHRVLALLMVMAALCMKLVVPSGYMIGQESSVLTVRICQDSTAATAFQQIAIPMKSTDSESDGAHGKASNTCPYATLSMASLASADTVLLAMALLFILALGFAPVRTSLPQRIAHLRPPLRGPPSLI